MRAAAALLVLLAGPAAAATRCPRDAERVEVSSGSLTAAACVLNGVTVLYLKGERAILRGVSPLRLADFDFDGHLDVSAAQAVFLYLPETGGFYKSEGLSRLHACEPVPAEKLIRCSTPALLEEYKIIKGLAIKTYSKAYEP